MEKQSWKALLNPRELWRFVKFGITGVMNTLVDFGVYTLLVELFSVNMYVAQIISYCCGMLNSYLVNRKWTFKTQSKVVSGELWRFILLNLSMMLLGMGVIWLGTQWLHCSPVLAKLLSSGVTLVVNFLVSNFWVFRNKGGDVSADQSSDASREGR